MPTQTFYNLPAKKRDKLMEAIREEFARVPFNDVSINKIIQTAEISRGSFYQYFEDKTDMLKFLLTDYKRMVFNKSIESLKNNNGDIFKMLIDLLDFTVEFVMKEQTNAFCKNLFADIQIIAGLYTDSSADNIHEMINILNKYVNREFLDIKTEEEFACMLNICFCITGAAIAQAFFDTSKIEYARMDYIKKLELLGRGFLKKSLCTL